MNLYELEWILKLLELNLQKPTQVSTRNITRTFEGKGCTLAKTRLHKGRLQESILHSYNYVYFTKQFKSQNILCTLLHVVDTYLVVMSPSRAEGFSAWLGS